MTTARTQPRESAEPEIEVLGEWDGYVEKILKDYFVGRMHGLQGNGVKGKEEEAEIPIRDVDDADRGLLVPGGFFRLIVSYEKKRVGPKRKFTQIVFRRLPAYTARELSAAEREADELLNAFQLAAGRQATGT